MQWAGDHLRPRVRVPPGWRWPVGVSLSSEFGYARAAYSNPTWSWQIMPIVDQTIGRWCWSVNSTLNKGVLVLPASATTEVDFTASNPGPTLFHCHSQSHTDFGFMALMRYS